MENEVRPRRDGKGTEFGLAHRDLPRQVCLTDVDSMSGILNETLSDLSHENDTWIEYRPTYGGCNFTAIFEMKQIGSAELTEALQCKRGGSIWAQFLISRRLACRFFIVEADRKKPPFKFYEVIAENEYRERGVLDYTSDDRTQKINEFWIRLNLLTDVEAKKQLSNLHEVEVIYLKNGQYDSRKFMRYETYDEALRIYKATISKFKKEDKKAILSLRSMNGVLWSMVKNERL